jgi:type IV secretion system protein VirB4
MHAEPINSHVAKNEVALANYLPFSSHITENIISTVNGEYMRIWKVGGISFEAADELDIATRHDGFNQLLRSIGGGGGVALWSHKVRRKVSDRLEGKFPSKFCSEFNERYYNSFAGYRMMANELYLTVVYNPKFGSSKVTRLFGKAVKRTIDQIARDQDEAIKHLNDTAHQVEQSLKKYDLEALGTYDYRAVKYSSALEFLAFLTNGYWERIPLRRARIREYLPSSRLFAGIEALEIRTPTDTRFASILDFSDFPEFTEPGILNPILYDDYEFIESQSFTMLNKHDAMKALELQRNQLIASEDVSTTQINEIDGAREDIVNGRFVMGDYYYSLAVFGQSIAEVGKNIAMARSSLQDQGFQTKLVDLVPDAAWFAQLPGNWRYRPRAAQISSRAFCGLSAFHNFAAGKRDGNPWGQAVTVLKTPSGQPYYFNFHVTPDDEDSEDKKALGNTMIVGQSGSGKTVVELMLIAQATKYDPTIVYFDKDRGAEIAIRAMGGKYFALKRNMPTGFNPFKLEPTPDVVALWEALIRKLVYHPTEPLTPTDEKEIKHAVDTVAGMPKHLRGIATVNQNIQLTSMNGVHARLEKWCAGGSLGWVLDNPDDLLDFGSHRIYGFDYTEFLEDAETRTPIMMYLMFLTEGLIDGRRFIYTMAEFWKPLDDEVFTDFVRNKQKTIRKQNGMGIFDTQSPDDALKSDISRALIEQCSTFIFLANPRASKQDYVDGFKLTEAEYDIVSSLGENSRMFLIKQGHQSAVARLDLSGFDEDLMVLSGTTDNVELLDRICEEVGDNPDDWMPLLKEAVARRLALGKNKRSASIV